MTTWIGWKRDSVGGWGVQSRVLGSLCPDSYHGHGECLSLFGRRDDILVLGIEKHCFVGLHAAGIKIHFNHLHDSQEPLQSREVEITCYTKLRDLLYCTLPYLTHSESVPLALILNF